MTISSLNDHSTSKTAPTKKLTPNTSKKTSNTHKSSSRPRYTKKSTKGIGNSAPLNSNNNTNSNSISKLLNDCELIFQWPQEKMGREEYMSLYTKIYNICTNADKQNHNSDNLPTMRNNGSSALESSSGDSSGLELYSALEKFIEKKVLSVLSKTQQVYNNCNEDPALMIKIDEAFQEISSSLNQKSSRKSQDSINDIYDESADPILAQLASNSNSNIAGTNINLNDGSSTMDSEETILKCYRENWINFLRSKRIFNGITSYLNRYWIKRQRDEAPETNILEISDLSLVTWKRQKFDKIQKLLTVSILKLVKRDRYGEKIDHNLLKIVIDSFAQLGIERTLACREQQNPTNNRFQSSAFQQKTDANQELSLSIYIECLEEQYLKELNEFYEEDSKNFIQSHSIEDYVKYAEEKILEEEVRCKNYWVCWVLNKIHSSAVLFSKSVSTSKPLLPFARQLQKESHASRQHQTRQRTPNKNT